ncbi:MAG TPA: helix-turn-helix domain-containing protein [Herpetosiphonaceae bacterium]
MSDSHPTDDDLTGGAAARLLGVTRQQVNRLAHEGKLPARQIAGRYWVFKRADVEAYKMKEKSKGGRPKKGESRRNDLIADDEDPSSR